MALLYFWALRGGEPPLRSWHQSTKCPCPATLPVFCGTRTRIQTVAVASRMASWCRRLESFCSPGRHTPLNTSPSTWIYKEHVIHIIKPILWVCSWVARSPAKFHFQQFAKNTVYTKLNISRLWRRAGEPSLLSCYPQPIPWLPAPARKICTAPPSARILEKTIQFFDLLWRLIRPL